MLLLLLIFEIICISKLKMSLLSASLKMSLLSNALLCGTKSAVLLIITPFGEVYLRNRSIFWVSYPFK